MYLKSIEINGFKSFANKTNLEFKEGITSIVGPNGSGKSNVLDAILWALGEQSYKNIRAKEGADVIFSGGKKNRAKSMAEVSLLIDNSKKILSIDYSEVKISRTIYKSGENEYRINNKKVRLKDINELFMDTGIGKTAYSVIGQGKVEQIIMANPAELKGIMEEAAGIKKIKKRKEEAEKNLKEVEDNIEKIEYIETDVLSNLEPLKKKAERAIQYKELKEKMDIMRTSLLKKQEFTAKNMQDGLSHKIDAQNEEIEKYEKLFEKESEALENINNEREKLAKSLEEQEEEFSDLKLRFEDIGNNKILYNERKSNYIREKSEKEEVLLEYKEKLQYKTVELSNLKQEAENIYKNFANEKEKIEKYQLEEKKYQEQIKKIEEQIKEYKNQIMEDEIKKIHQNNEIDQNKKNENFIKTRLDNLSNDLQSTQKNIENLEEKIKKYNETLEEIMQNKKNAKNKQQSILEEKNIYLKELDELKKEKLDIEYSMQNREMKLENISNLEKNHEGFFRGVKKILNSNISGVRGAFVSVVEIPAKYETAIQSAIANGLQDIVVESSEVAKQCIDLLKKSNEGRASFLPFDTIKSYPKKQSPNFPGVLGLASELVSYTHDYEKIVNFVLGNVLIVEKIEVGIKLVKQNMFSGNIVSLDGDIISGRGKISGGEKLKNNLGFLFERQREKKSLEADLEQKKERLDILEVSITERKEKIEIIESDELKYNNEIETSKNEIFEINRLLDKEKDILSNHIKKESLFNEEIENEKQNLIDLTSKYNDFKTKSKEYDLYIKERNEEIRVLQNSLENTKKLLEKNTKEHSEQRILLIKHEEKYNSISEKLKAFENECNEIEEKKKILELKLSKIELELKKTEEQLENNEYDYIAVKKKYETDNEIIRKMKKESKDYEAKEKEKIIKVKDIESKIIVEKNSFSKKIREQEKLRMEIATIENNLNQISVEYDVDMAVNEKKTREEIDIIERKILNLGEVNLFAIEEYDELNQKYIFLSEQKKDLVDSKKMLGNLIKDIENDIKDKFLEAYNAIRNNFSYMCKEVLNNSKGDIILSCEKDILKTGLELVVKFQNKKTQTLSLKSMVAVAFIMAIFMYKPSPFTFFDEIEAALDETNTRKLIVMLKRFTNESQFILITHNKETMKESDMLYGVTMNKDIGVSKLVSVEM